MKVADGSQGNVNPENRLGYFLTTPASHSMKTCEMSKKCGESWTNT